MGSLKIKKLEYRGDNYYYKNDKFKNGLNILVGDNGNGKSTFTYLLVYALGAKVQWFNDTTKEPLVEILEDSNNYVELEIIINGLDYTFRRKIGENFISIYSHYDEEIKIYNITRKGYYYEKEKKTFSDWMFERLNINLAEITQYESTHRINFEDIMRYIYYDQITDNNIIISEFGIDRNDRYRNSNLMKRSIFELIMSSYFKEFYDTHYQIKNLNNQLQEKKEFNKSLTTLMDNIKKNISGDFNENISFGEELKRVQKELFRIKSLREKINEININGEENDNLIECIIDIQKKLVAKIHEQKNYEFKNEEIERYLLKFRNLYQQKENEIKHIEKILFTANYIDIINEDKCPFCQEELNLEDNICICGSNKSINFSKFIYSDKEYKEIIKSKVKSIKTIESTIKEYEDRYIQIKDKINKTKSCLDELNSKLKTLNNNIIYDVTLDRASDLTQNYMDLREKEHELELIISKQKEIDKSSKEVDKLDNSIKKKKEKLEELQKEKDDILQENLNMFEKIYSEYLIDYYNDEGKKFVVKLDRNYTPFLNVYREKSFTVPKKFFYYLTLLDVSLNDKLNINYPRFLIIDTIKDAGLEMEDLKRLMRYLLNYQDKDCQIILTCGYDEYSTEFKPYEIDYLSDSNMLLKKYIDMSSDKEHIEIQEYEDMYREEARLESMPKDDADVFCEINKHDDVIEFNNLIEEYVYNFNRYTDELVGYLGDIDWENINSELNKKIIKEILGIDKQIDNEEFQQYIDKFINDLSNKVEEMVYESEFNFGIIDRLYGLWDGCIEISIEGALCIAEGNVDELQILLRENKSIIERGSIEKTYGEYYISDNGAAMPEVDDDLKINLNDIQANLDEKFYDTIEKLKGYISLFD